MGVVSDLGGVASDGVDIRSSSVFQSSLVCSRGAKMKYVWRMDGWMDEWMEGRELGREERKEKGREGEREGEKVSTHSTAWLQ